MVELVENLELAFMGLQLLLIVISHNFDGIFFGPICFWTQIFGHERSAVVGWPGDSSLVTHPNCGVLSFAQLFALHILFIKVKLL